MSSQASSAAKAAWSLFVPELHGQVVSLEPLSLVHISELQEAVGVDDLHKLWYAKIPSPEEMEKEIERRLRLHQQAQMMPWLIRVREDGRAAGMTTFISIRPEHRHLEIGFSWIRSDLHGSVVNTEAKLLQLEYAFETMECVAVEFRTHWHNLRSRSALEAFGAKQDGVLRNHDLWKNGTIRDLVVFSVIDREWPTVKQSLLERRERKSSQNRSWSGE